MLSIPEVYGSDRMVERWIQEWLEDHFELDDITTRVVNKARRVVLREGSRYRSDVRDILYEAF